MNTSLSEIRKYRFQPVIDRFAQVFPEQKEQANQLFEDLMIFFWGTKQQHILKDKNPGDQDLDFLFIMDAKMKPIDEMWHVFLLFTKPYMEFCDKYFGEYIHHTPNIAPTLPSSEESYEQNLRRFLSFSYDYLGEDVVKRWFQVT